MVFLQRLGIRFTIFSLFLALAGCGGSSSSPSTSATPGTYTLSGTIAAATGSAIDGDTNDPVAPYTANNTPATAQVLPNPVVLGGYTTASPTAVAGDRFATTADVQDWYKITLAAGQTITLTICDHDGNPANNANPDLDLFLTDLAGVDVQSSESLERQESIIVAAAGDYLINVYDNLGASNYILRVGQVPGAVTNSALHIEDDFVPDDVIVRFREVTAASGVTPASVTDRAAALGLDRRAGRAGHDMLFRLGPSSQAVQTQSVNSGASHRVGRTAPGQEEKRRTLDLIKTLRRRSDVISADPNYIRQPYLTPNDLYFSTQWNLPLINLPQAWDVTQGSSDVVVAVVDTGVLFGHPDLTGRFCQAGDDCQGYDFISDPVSAADGDGIDSDPSDPGDESLSDGSSSFHGTHVSGIVGAAGNNGIGVAGIDWKARLMPVRVLGVGGGTSYDVIQGVRYAAGLSNDSGTVPTKHADIINLSLGGMGYSSAEQSLFQQLHDAGIMVMAAAGNSASSSPTYPAGYAGVIAVSAVDVNKNLASYSNYGTAIDVAAPGGDLASDHTLYGDTDGVLSTCGDDSRSVLRYTYVEDMGTSMASPHVAGVAALMKAVDPALTATDFDNLLKSGALTEDLGEDGATVRNDSFGYGLIDAQKSVLAALDQASTESLPPSLAISPSLLNFGSVATSLPLNLSNAGGGTLHVTGISASSPWISAVTLTNESSTGTGLGDYIVTVDRTGLADAVYTATLSIATAEAGTYSVSVQMQVGSGIVSNVGFQHVSLVDADSGVVVQTLGVAADPVNGTYQYSFTGVAPGNYLVTAGSDSDHDGQTCDPGEACGKYPLLSDPATLSVSSGNLTGVDFTSSFDANQR